MSAAPGTMLSSTIRLVRPLGAGGMGAVWIADHLALRTQVVVKLLADGLASSATALARFSREAAAASQVKSPHVVQMLDYGVAQDGTPFIVMELLEGRDLGAELKRGGPMPLARFAVLFEQMASALSRAHERGVIHRDIKPENVFLCDVGQREWFVKVLDFGIAKGDAAETDRPQTSTGATVGTPYYMSPEQLAGARDVDYRSDLWALGVVAFEALTGTRPFEGDTYYAIAIAANQGPTVVPSQLNRGLPPAVDNWYLRACARDRAHRFTSANEMAQALSAIAANGGAQGWNPNWAYQATAAQTPAYTPATAANTPGFSSASQPKAPLDTKKKSRLPMILGLLGGLAALAGGSTAIALLVVPRLHATSHRKPAPTNTAVAIVPTASASAAASSAPVVLDEIRFLKRNYVVGEAYDEEFTMDDRLNYTAPQQGFGGAVAKQRRKIDVLETDGQALTRLKVSYLEHSFTATRVDGSQIQIPNPLHGKTYVVEVSNGVMYVRDEHNALAPTIEDQGVRAEWGTLSLPDQPQVTVPDAPMKRGDESAAFTANLERIVSGVDKPQFEGVRAVLKDIVAEGKETIGVFDFSAKETITAAGMTSVHEWSGTFSVRASDSRIIRFDLSGPQRYSGRIEGTGISELKLARTTR